MKHRVFLAAAIAALVIGFAPAAEAQDDIGVRRVGIRGGLTVDPDQGHIGLHVNAGQFAPKVRFQPSFEIGFGSDRVVGTFNIDAMYTFDPRPWVPYLGGGVGVSLIHRDSDNDNGSGVNVEAGLNLLGGFEWGEASKYLLELRVGVGDIPDFKVTVGVNF